jgi:PAS domain S-box-containing protein
MKSRDIIPTNHERILPVDRYILSTTDLSGRITSANDLFIEYSGYSEAELIDVQHNIIRHPDMPRTVFWMMWEAIKDGEDFSGYVKNLSKDGGFYWVYAHILPLANTEGDVIGFRSVRRHPKREAVEKVAALYSEILAAELAAGPKNAIDAGLGVLRGYLVKTGLSYEQLFSSF